MSLLIAELGTVRSFSIQTDNWPFCVCGDDMEFANPVDDYIDSLVYFPTPLAPQSGTDLAAPDIEETGDPSKPLSEATMPIMAASINPADGLNSICFGEKITSVRALLKRYSATTLYGVPVSGLIEVAFRRVSMNFPLYRGYAPNGIHSAGGTPYNYYKSSVIKHNRLTRNQKNLSSMR
jgi:hypothetical protein